MSTVFISYARADAELVRPIYSALVEAGYDAWLDTERLVGGSPWKLEVTAAIRSAAAFIAVLSTRSVNHRGYVQRELKEALEVLKLLPSNQIYLIPVRLEAVEPTEPALEELTWIDMFPSVEKGMERILRTLATVPALSSGVPRKRGGAARSASPVVPFPRAWSVYKALLSLLPPSSRRLGGDNGLYMLLRMDAPGLEVPAYLHDAHPDTMAIVLQYQYAKLRIGKESFSVELTFSGKQETLVVPYAAILFLREESTGMECRGRREA